MSDKSQYIRTLQSVSDVIDEGIKDKHLLHQLTEIMRYCLDKIDGVQPNKPREEKPEEPAKPKRRRTAKKGFEDLAEDDKNKILELANGTHTVTQIANLAKVTKDAVEKTLQEKGVALTRYPIYKIGGKKK